MRLGLSFDIACVSLPLPELTAQDRHAQSQGVISGGFQTWPRRWAQTSPPGEPPHPHVKRKQHLNLLGLSKGTRSKSQLCFQHGRHGW